jgi:type IV pilus assembly protein PilY1
MRTGQDGWRMYYPPANQGEQTVTSSVIFGGTIFFSTNRPTATPANSCATNLGEARGYAVNLLNASGVIGSGALCGGDRSDTFVGGGIPPSPVVGTVQVQTAEGLKTIPLLIGAANIAGDAPSFSIGGQQPPVPIQQIRSRVYWYRHGDK